MNALFAIPASPSRRLSDKQRIASLQRGAICSQCRCSASSTAAGGAASATSPMRNAASQHELAEGGPAGMRRAHSSAVHLGRYNLASWVVGVPRWNLAMKPLLIVLAAAGVLATGSTLAVMNNACKSARHPWCASHIPQLRTAHRLAPCSGQATLPAVKSIEPLVPTRRLGRGPDSPSHSLVVASPARLGR